MDINYCSTHFRTSPCTRRLSVAEQFARLSFLATFRGRNMVALYLRMVVLVAILLLHSCCLAVTRFPKSALQIIEAKERLVYELAEEAASLFKRRGRDSQPCDCSVHICDMEFSQNACDLVYRDSLAVCGKAKCAATQNGGAITFVSTPSGIDLDAVGHEMKESVCLYRNLEPVLMQLDPEANTTTRISTKDGHSRIYPSRPMRLSLTEEERATCPDTDPRNTADYVGASVGPKDVIFVVDTSKDMAKPWSVKSRRSRLASISEAVQSLLDTLSSMDRVNLVAYSDKARRRGTGQGLFPGTARHLYLLKSSIQSLHPHGQSNVREGIKLGFKLLLEANRGKGGKRDASHRGQKILVVVTGSSNHRGRNGRPIEHEEFLLKVEQLQDALEDASGVRARIFTFSIGDDVDDALLKQISCANGGAWFSVGPDDDAFQILNAYNVFMASTFAASFPIWTNFRMDPYGAGRITTVAKSFHFLPNNGQNPLLLGVVSHDVRLRDLMVENLTRVDIEEELVKRSRKHDIIDVNACQLQVYRNVFAQGSICVDTPPPIPSKSDERSGSRKGKRHRVRKAKEVETPACLKREGIYYKMFRTRVTWNEAASSCRNDSGVLVSGHSAEDLEFLAGMASADGTWIGGRRTSKNQRFRWSAAPKRDPVEFDIQDKAIGVGDACVRIDNRGAVGNLEAVPCRRELSYICAYQSQDHCSKTIPIPKRGYFTIPLLNACQREEEALFDASTMSSVSVASSSQLWCSLDNGPRDLRSLCCQRCKGKSLEEEDSGDP